MHFWVFSTWLTLSNSMSSLNFFTHNAIKTYRVIFMSNIHHQIESSYRAMNLNANRPFSNQKGKTQYQHRLITQNDKICTALLFNWVSIRWIKYTYFRIWFKLDFCVINYFQHGKLMCDVCSCQSNMNILYLMHQNLVMTDSKCNLQYTFAYRRLNDQNWYSLELKVNGKFQVAVVKYFI